MTIRDLETLLQDQKRKVIERIAGNSYLYNTESTPSHAKPLPIDKEKMKEIGMKAPFPEEFNTLKKYIKSDD